MNYLKKTFSVGLGSDAYRSNYEAVFGKKPDNQALLDKISAIGQEQAANEAHDASEAAHEHDFWPVARFSSRTMCACGAEGPADAPGEAILDAQEGPGEEITGSGGGDTTTPENSSGR